MSISITTPLRSMILYYDDWDMPLVQVITLDVSADKVHIVT